MCPRPPHVPSCSCPLSASYLCARCLRTTSLSPALPPSRLPPGLLWPYAALDSGCRLRTLNLVSNMRSLPPHPVRPSLPPAGVAWPSSGSPARIPVAGCVGSPSHCQPVPWSLPPRHARIWVLAASPPSSGQPVTVRWPLPPPLPSLTSPVSCQHSSLTGPLE